METNASREEGSCAAAGRPLPEWVASVCDGDDAAKATALRYSVLPTASDGDCLFHSVHLCLRSVMGDRAYTPHELRYAVASTVMDAEDREASAAIELWRAVVSARGIDEQIGIEYKFASPLAHAPSARAVPKATRKRLFANMMSKGLYWGDQYAVRCLERKLNVRLLILSETLDVHTGRRTCAGNFGMEYPPGFRPGWYFVLLLQGAHYMPIAKFESRHGQADGYVAAFRGRDVPGFARRAFA